MRIGLGQINPTVGDLNGNRELILDKVREAEFNGCDFILFPELALTGYPPEDLILKPSFIRENLAALKDIARHIKKAAVVVGFIDQVKDKRFNAAAWIQDGKIKTVYHKNCLPNYGVFDERRYFSKGNNFKVVSFKGLRIGLTICEDLWLGPSALRNLKKLKPNLVLNLSASPYHANKLKERVQTIRESVRFMKTPLLYCNMVGGQDELVFDGGSFYLSDEGRPQGLCPQFEDGLHTFDLVVNRKKLTLYAPSKHNQKFSPPEEIYQALVTGLRDYVNKNGFKTVTLGLSGGIDSALVAVIAVEALGADRVKLVTMPSRFNLSETKDDAHLLAKNLKAEIMEIPIQEIFEKYKDIMAPHFKNLPPNIAEENLQARIRGNILMGLSNKFGWLVLTTGNKSEMSTGYSTLYGDMAGGFAVLKDVLKTTVYDISNFINESNFKEIIPKRIITRPPTAELREDQKDEDSLGPYKNLDQIVTGYVEQNLPIKNIVRKTKLPAEYVERIIRLIDRNEYKRRQSPPGIKITTRAFGRDHRMPITNRFTDKAS